MTQRVQNFHLVLEQNVLHVWLLKKERQQRNKWTITVARNNKNRDWKTALKPHKANNSSKIISSVLHLLIFTINIFPSLFLSSSSSSFCYSSSSSPSSLHIDFVVALQSCADLSNEVLVLQDFKRWEWLMSNLWYPLKMCVCMCVGVWVWLLRTSYS